MTDGSNKSAISSPATSTPPANVLVWDLPLRVFHWLLAVAVPVAWFSANVYDSVHEIAGYTVLGLVAFRLVWGFAGSRHARFRSFVQPPRVVLGYLWRLLHGRTGRYLGHNPAGAAMTVTLLALLAVATISGWMQLTQRFFGVAWVEELHRYSSNLVLILAIVHVLGVLLMCRLQRENLVGAMFTGRKTARTEDS